MYKITEALQSEPGVEFKQDKTDFIISPDSKFNLEHVVQNINKKYIICQPDDNPKTYLEQAVVGCSLHTVGIGATNHIVGCDHQDVNDILATVTTTSKSLFLIEKDGEKHDFALHLLSDLIFNTKPISGSVDENTQSIVLNYRLPEAERDILLSQVHQSGKYKYVVIDRGNESRPTHLTDTIAITLAIQRPVHASNCNISRLALTTAFPTLATELDPYLTRCTLPVLKALPLLFDMVDNDLQFNCLSKNPGEHLQTVSVDAAFRLFFSNQLLRMKMMLLPMFQTDVASMMQAILEKTTILPIRDGLINAQKKKAAQYIRDFLLESNTKIDAVKKNCKELYIQATKAAFEMVKDQYYQIVNVIKGINVAFNNDFPIFDKFFDEYAQTLARYSDLIDTKTPTQSEMSPLLTRLEKCETDIGSITKCTGVILLLSDILESHLSNDTFDNFLLLYEQFLPAADYVLRKSAKPTNWHTAIIQYIDDPQATLGTDIKEKLKTKAELVQHVIEAADSWMVKYAEVLKKLKQFNEAADKNINNIKDAISKGNEFLAEQDVNKKKDLGLARNNVCKTIDKDIPVLISMCNADLEPLLVQTITEERIIVQHIMNLFLDPAVVEKAKEKYNCDSIPAVIKQKNQMIGSLLSELEQQTKAITGNE